MQVVPEDWDVAVVSEVGSRIHPQVCKNYQPSVDISQQSSKLLTAPKCRDSRWIWWANVIYPENFWVGWSWWASVGGPVSSGILQPRGTGHAVVRCQDYVGRVYESGLVSSGTHLHQENNGAHLLRGLWHFAGVIFPSKSFESESPDYQTPKDELE